MKILGIDLGGTSIKSGLVDEDGTIAELKRTATPANDIDASKSIALLAEIVTGYLQTHKLGGIGLCVPGIIDSDTGTAVYSGTLGWRNVPIASSLLDLTGIPTFLEHDVTASGLAEFQIGSAKGAQSALILAIGTGIAGCFVLNGEISRPHPAVGEIGHSPTRNYRPCVCGKNGCLEMTVSGGALVRNYEALSGVKTDPVSIFNGAKGNDPSSKDIVNEFYETLAFSIHFVASTVGPEMVVIAGGIGDADSEFKSRLESELDKVLGIQLRPDIRMSKLSGTSGCIGAALSARNQMALN